MKKFLWIILGAAFFFQHATASSFQSETGLDGLQQKIARYVAANQSLIGLALTEEELSDLEASPEKYLPPMPALATQKDLLSQQLELMMARGQITVQDMNRAMADMENILTDYSDDERTASMDAAKDGDTKTNTHCGGVFCTTTLYVWIGGQWRIVSVVTYLSVWPYTVIKK